MNDRPPRVVFATRNRGKLRELRAIFAGSGIEVLDLVEAGLPDEDPDEELLEVHGTFEENARAKARWFASRLPGRVVLADDSGLAVDALDGAPGVRSKRWSGSVASGAQRDADNIDALLLAMRAASDRAARFVAVVVCVDGDREWVARGVCEGRILSSARGTHGFGYDPVFWSEELGASFGEATDEAKARVSHRGRSLRGLLAQWHAPKI
jgi:XTP/dITP diphosphohydrolase